MSPATFLQPQSSALFKAYTHLQRHSCTPAVPVPPFLFPEEAVGSPPLSWRPCKVISTSQSLTFQRCLYPLWALPAKYQRFHKAPASSPRGVGVRWERRFACIWKASPVNYNPSSLVTGGGDSLYVFVLFCFFSF